MNIQAQQKEHSAIDKLKKQVVCPVELALRVLGGKWRGSIIYQLKDGPLRFNQLKYNVQDAVVNYDDADNFLSNKVLSLHLNDLIEYGLVEKEEQEPHFLYQLTDKGESAMPILLDLFYWGENQF
jgi:DNA-binding HxlR family transcriptional regulator